MKALLYFAFVLAVLGSFWSSAPPVQGQPWYYGRINLLSAAFACYIGSLIF